MSCTLSGPVTVLGGLRLWAEATYTVDYWGECHSGVSGLYWLKRNGTRGKEVSQKFIDGLEKRQRWWEDDVCLELSEEAAYRASEE
jgi:hypothetical protein